MAEASLLAESPEAVGIDPSRLAALFDRAEREIRDGILPSAQLAIARHGKVAAMRSFGAARFEGREAPVSNDTLYVIFSCTKAITSSAAWLLLEAGKLGLDERVADVLPGFGTNGKDAVTVEHLFTHTAGFPHAPFDPRGFEWPRLAERFVTWRLNWEPGTRFEYHPSSSMWVIAAIVQERSGIAFLDFVRTRITEPLGLTDLFVGCPRAEHGRVADITHVGRAWTNEELLAKGLPIRPETEVTEENLQRFNLSEVREAGVPGGGGIATAADLALFHQALVAGGRGVWRPETIEDARRIRNPGFLDPLFRKPANRGLGIVTANGPEKVYFGFGRTASDATFGHGGAGGQIAWADPVTGISFAYLTNGHDRDLVREGRRITALSSLAAVCAAGS